MIETASRTARRIGVGIVGSGVLLVGIAMIVLPGPAFLVIPAALTILGTEFAFARRWLHLGLGRGARSPGRRAGAPDQRNPRPSMSTTFRSGSPAT
ncbi:MAG: PGPGW domain-containing protein [Myxococcota bacterium]|nr:PGPGW domain-containing protein [Myxococcota bacterium]